MKKETPTTNESENDNDRIAAICSVLADERRIAVINALKPVNEMRITQLIDVVAVDSDDVERVRISLYHDSLPKLAEVGAIGYDWDADMIRCGPQYRLFPDVIEAVRQVRS